MMGLEDLSWRKEGKWMDGGSWGCAMIPMQLRECKSFVDAVAPKL